MSDSLKFQVSLAAQKNERVTSRLVAGFNSEGDLVLEGQDIGSFVEEVWGRDEYEYWLTVSREAIPRLAEELGRESNQPSPTDEAREPFVMDVLKKLFSQGEAPLHFASDSEFRKWLDARGIPSEFSSWP